MIFGCLARNTFQPFMDKYYQEQWTGYIRSFCLQIILFRAGLQLDVKGNVRNICMLSSFPIIIEVIVAALVAMQLFGFDIYMAMTLGTMLSGIGNAVLIDCILQLTNQGYGVNKNIGKLCIAVGIMNGIVSNILFPIFKNMTLSASGNGSDSLLLDLGLIVLQLVVGTIVGILIGYFFKLLNVKNNLARVVLVVSTILAVQVICDLKIILSSKKAFAPEAKTLASVFLGITLRNFWDKNSINKYLAKLWLFLAPFLFATIGGSVIMSKLKSSDILMGLIVLLCCVVARSLLTFFITSFKTNFNFKEKFFLSIAFTPKAAMQAALSPVILQEAQAKHIDQYIQPGESILNVGILAIMVFSPLGAFLINQIGQSWLHRTLPQLPTTQSEKISDA